MERRLGAERAQAGTSASGAGEEEEAEPESPQAPEEVRGGIEP